MKILSLAIRIIGIILILLFATPFVLAFLVNPMYLFLLIYTAFFGIPLLIIFIILVVIDYLGKRKEKKVYSFRK